MNISLLYCEIEVKVMDCRNIEVTFINQKSNFFIYSKMVDFHFKETITK